MEEYDVIVVGAGFSGLYALHRLRAMGMRVVVFEAGGDVGGTWYWNCYPGARCDLYSMDYSYSFSEELQQEWTWTERYPSQPEILRYINHVADRFKLRSDIRLGTKVVSAKYDETRNRWTVLTDGGATVEAQFCIMATGCLSSAKVPDIPGLESFKGRRYHSGRWPKETVSFGGLRVGVIGVGSTGIQMIPEIAVEAEHLFVFQRTANFAIPARNRALARDEVDKIKQQYPAYREKARNSPDGAVGEPPRASGKQDTLEERRAFYEERWRKGGMISMLSTYQDLMIDRGVNASLGEFVSEKIRREVRDQKVAEKLVPNSHLIGTKRLCQEIDYFSTYNRDNVTLVDLRETPIQTITGDGIQTTEREYELDVIVFATGFDAITGALLAIDIEGIDGIPLKEKWEAGPQAYLGLVAAGFPNMFMVTGPGSPSVKGNMVVSIEQHVEFVTDTLAYMKQRGLSRIDADPTAERSWMEHVREVADKTLYPTAESWYVGANVPGKPRVFLPYVGGMHVYRQRCAQVAADNYQGFVLA